MSVQERFLFLHIPKTAGTSLNEIIERNFIKEEILDLFLMRDAVKVSDEKLSRYRLVRGHYSYSMLEKFIVRPRMLLMLRDPIKRSISNLRHIKNTRRGDFWLRKQRDLKNTSLDDLIKDRKVQDWLRDYEVKWIAGNFNVRNFTTPMILQIPRKIDREYLELAKLRLHAIDFLGITERFSKSVELLCNTFCWRKPKKIPNKNMAVERRGWDEEISPKSLKILNKITEYDRELYDYGLELFEKRRNFMVN